RTAVAVLATVFLFNLLGRGSGDTYAVFLLPLEREFGWARSQLTSVYSMYLLVGAFIAPLAGTLFDRYGPRTTYSGGLACLAAAFFLASSLGNLWEFYLFVGVMIGVGVGLVGMVPASALLTRWYRVRLSTAIGIAFSAAGMGGLIFVPLAQGLIGLYDWRTTYRILAALLLFAVPFALFAIPWKRFVMGLQDSISARDARQAGEGWSVRTAMRTRLYWALVQVFFFTATAMFIVLVQAVVYFIDIGFSPIAAATAYGFTGMLSVVSVSLSGLLAERFGFRQVVSASFAGTATGVLVLLALSYLPAAALLALFVLVFGLCMGVRGPIISAIATRQFAGPRVATIYGTIYSANAIGAAFGSLMGGVLHDLTGGYRTGFALSVCAVAMAVAPFWTVPALRNFR
ncbi:MAG TPA: MFS transporter, partial [Burkholderiales bacterium]|nr:MFS transporter [Burkholderiales bacterium]